MPPSPNEPVASHPDPHSRSNPERVRVRHLALDLEVSFERRSLSGTATLHVQRLDPGATRLLLDTRALEIAAVEAAEGERPWSPTGFDLGAADPILGSALAVTLPPLADRVRIRYATRPEASGLQWLSPPQTAGRTHPFLFSQSQAIHARSWIPIQDSPGVRLTYEATIRTPPALRAVMSAAGNSTRERGGTYRFRMPQAIPAYLLALAVGDLDFASLGPQIGRAHV